MFLGFRAGFSETTSNKLIIESGYTGTDNATNALIYGDFSTDYLGINGLLRINSNNLALSVSLGSGATPINYIYQGVARSSDAKDYAVAIYDPLWVSGLVWAISFLTTTDKRFKKNIVSIS
ncbi:MAG: hypothetical protein GQ564_00460 [Bacteroidales bacterium]|nr:hypothetical protein [Bacteroidales bacterium]